MPTIYTKLKPPYWGLNGHFETIGRLFQPLPKTPTPEVRRLELPDTDFLDYDLYTNPICSSRKLVIFSHGLEGNSKAGYILHLLETAFQSGFNVLCWNMRGCGIESNRLPSAYHSGMTSDLNAIVELAIQLGFDQIFLVGFSLGGNLTLKYLGESFEVHDKIKGAMVVSVPCHLASAAEKIIGFSCILYHQRFMLSLTAKVRKKATKFQELGHLNGVKFKNLIDFDDQYTSKIHGFLDAEHYYSQNSSIYFIPNIKTPTHILNSANDPFLSRLCFPIIQSNQNEFVTLEITNRGGHVGFFVSGKEKELLYTKIVLKKLLSHMV